MDSAVERIKWDSAKEEGMSSEGRSVDADASDYHHRHLHHPEAI